LPGFFFCSYQLSVVSYQLTARSDASGQPKKIPVVHTVASVAGEGRMPRLVPDSSCTLR